MSGQKRNLVIVPGLGDRVGLYKFCKPFWSMLGYSVYIYSFGWESQSRSLKELQSDLMEYARKLGVCDMIGASAGGTAVINTLVSCPLIVSRVITVCTPYQELSSLKNELLKKSLKNSISSLETMNDEMKNRIHSAYALWDGVVATKYSQPGTVRRIKLFSIGHGFTICLALTLYSGKLNRALSENVL